MYLQLHNCKHFFQRYITYMPMFASITVTKVYFYWKKDHFEDGSFTATMTFLLIHMLE